MLNSVIIMGRLTADPDLRSTTSGVSVTSFTVACDRAYQVQGQERACDFIDCVAWRQNAEFISKYFHKGSMIAVQGQLQTRSYEDKNGNKRKAVEVVVDRASFTGSKAESSGSGERFGAEQNPIPAASYQTAGPEDFSDTSGGDDELPF